MVEWLTDLIYNHQVLQALALLGLICSKSSFSAGSGQVGTVLMSNQIDSTQ